MLREDNTRKEEVYEPGGVGCDGMACAQGGGGALRQSLSEPEG